MKAQELRDIAARLNRWADELDGIKTDGGAIKVKLPQPDLFSQMGLTTSDMRDQVDDLIVTQQHGQEPEPEAPAKRIYKRVGCKMRDEAIVAANKVGRAQGYCQRNDIERSLNRCTDGWSREEVRQAVNEAVSRLGLTCIVFNSYRYYRRADRQRIIDTTISILQNE